MCGIAGIYGYANASGRGIDRSALSRISEQMKRRGPDDAGLWFNNDNRIGLAHRRLAIIDPGPSGHQPMASGDAKHAITFNGEIYNYRFLQQLLRDRGQVLNTDSDTEVLLGLYRLFGQSMLEHLRGMYTFAIWDVEKQGLFIARDPYGIKPLYYADVNGDFQFASQLKALLSGGAISRQTNPVAEASFLLTGSVMEPDTAYLEIRALAAGHSIWVDQNGMDNPREFFRISDLFDISPGVPDDLSEMTDQAKTALLDSVKHHLVADVPVGAFLSAGVDSGALAGLATEVLDSPVHTVTIGFDEYRGTHDDETQLAARVSRQYATHHSQKIVTYSEFTDDFDNILEAMDQPTIDGVNTWFVSKAAAETGIKVMLSGVGGDELLGGYPSFVDIPKWRRRFGLGDRLPLLGTAFSQLAGPLGFLPVSPKAFGMFKYSGSFAGGYLLRRGLFMPWELKKLMGRDRAAAALEQLSVPACFNPELGTSDDFQNIAAMESQFYLRNQLLRDTDWASMAHSLEVRTPLVDTSLTKSLIPLVATRPGKHWLAQAPSSALPEQVTHRAKTGFTTPIANWLAKTPQLDQWKKFPWLDNGNGHWSRKYAVSLHQRLFVES